MTNSDIPKKNFEAEISKNWDEENLRENIQLQDVIERLRKLEIELSNVYNSKIYRVSHPIRILRKRQIVIFRHIRDRFVSRLIVCARFVYSVIPLKEKKKRKIKILFYKALKSNQKIITSTSSPTAIPGIEEVLEKRGIMQKITQYGSPNLLLCLPFVSRGGALTSAKWFVNAANHYFSKNGTVIVVESDRKGEIDDLHLGENVIFITYEIFDEIRLLCDLNQDEVLLSIVRLLRPKLLHNINSETAWHVFTQNFKEFSRFGGVFHSIFAYQYDKNGTEIKGYAQKFLELGIRNSHGVITDNWKFFDQAKERHPNLDVVNRLNVLPHPVESTSKPMGECHQSHVERGKKVLWYGRFGKDKNPELLIRIAEKLPEVTFDLYAPNVNDSAKELSLANLRVYEGPYRMSDIPNLCCYSGLLFTSNWEGFPNVILEAASLGLPIITPIVGGIGDLINDNNGWIVDIPNDATSYADSIKICLESEEEAKNKSENLVKVVNETRNFSTFVSKLAEINNYFVHQTKKACDSTFQFDISVIVPCFNQAKFLHESVISLNSIFNLKIEIIIVDDGSTESATSRILQSILSNSLHTVRIIKQVNRGLSSARNTGLETAQGKYVQFLDADDVITAQKVISSHKAAENNKEIDLVFSNYVLASDSLKIIELPNRISTGPAFDLENLLKYWERGYSIPIHSALLRRDLISGIRFNEELRGKEDWIFWVQVSLKEPKWIAIGNHGAIYRQHDGSMRRNHYEMLRNWQAAKKYLVENFSLNYPELEAELTAWESNYYAPLVAQERIRRRFKTIRKIARKFAIAGVNFAYLEIKTRERLYSRKFDSKDNLITVVIPAYNNAWQFKKCVVSILRQSLKIARVVIIDDNSQDYKMIYLVTKMFNGQHPRSVIRVTRNATNKGIVETQNALVNMANSKFVGFLDCDDWLHINALKVWEKNYKEHPKAEYFFTDRIDVQGIKREKITYGGYPNLKFKSDTEIPEDLLRGMVASHFKVISRQKIISSGGFKQDFEGVQDWDLALRLKDDIEFKYIPFHAYFYRRHRHSQSRTNTSKMIQLSNIISREMNIDFSQTNKFIQEILIDESFNKTSLLSIQEESIRKKTPISVKIDRSVTPEVLNFLKEENFFVQEIITNDLQLWLDLLPYFWNVSKLKYSWENWDNLKTSEINRG